MASGVTPMAAARPRSMAMPDSRPAVSALETTSVISGRPFMRRRMVSPQRSTSSGLRPVMVYW